MARNNAKRLALDTATSPSSLTPQVSSVFHNPSKRKFRGARREARGKSFGPYVCKNNRRLHGHHKVILLGGKMPRMSSYQSENASSFSGSLHNNGSTANLAKVEVVTKGNQ